MRSSNKSRSRNKNNNRRGNNNHGGNIINRVFDSSGPEGKVRGTPQQIIDKYQGLARDAQLSGDRIAHENFLQHSEHYSRMLSEAHREMAERKEAQDAQRQSQQQNKQQNQSDEQPAPVAAPAASDDQPDISGSTSQDLFPASQPADDNLVSTPEEGAKKPRGKRPAKPKPEADVVEIAIESTDSGS